MLDERIDRNRTESFARGVPEGPTGLVERMLCAVRGERDAFHGDAPYPSRAVPPSSPSRTPAEPLDASAVSVFSDPDSPFAELPPASRPELSRRSNEAPETTRPGDAPHILT